MGRESRKKGRRRSRSRRDSRQAGDKGSGDESDGATITTDGQEPYRLEILTERHGTPLPMFDIPVEDCVEGVVGDVDAERVLPHICANLGGGYAIRVTNASSRHIACAVLVDGENALLRDGSLIVAPRDCRVLPGFLVSKNFVGREYVKEYRDFRFGKPKVVEGDAPATAAEEMPYTAYGRISCEVFEAVMDEEVDSDQELRGQTTFYRGAGLNGSFEDRMVPEGKKKHFLYSSVTVQGARSSIANSTRGRWWVRGPRKIGALEVRYREAHSLMLLGVDPKAMGLARCKEEGSQGDLAKKEEDDKLEEKLDKRPGGPESGHVEHCDLTAAGDDDADAVQGAKWSVVHAIRAQAVDVETAS